MKSDLKSTIIRSQHCYSLDDSGIGSDERKPPFADHENVELEDDSSEENFEKPEDDSSEKKPDLVSASESDKKSEKKGDTDFYFSDDRKDDDESKEDTANKKVSCRTVCAPLMDYETCAVPRCDYKVGTIKDLCEYLCHHQKEHCEEVCD